MKLPKWAGLWQMRRTFREAPLRSAIALLLALSPGWKALWSLVGILSDIEFLTRMLSSIPWIAMLDLFTSYGEWVGVVIGFAWLGWLIRSANPQKQAPKLANPETFEQVRQVWGALSKSANYVSEVLSVLLVALGEQKGARKASAILLVPKLAEFKKLILNVDECVRRENKSREEMETLLLDVYTLIDLYHEMYNYWMWLESDTRGDRTAFLKSDSYRQFFNRHEELCREVARRTARHDIGVILDRDFLRPGQLPAPGA